MGGSRFPSSGTFKAISAGLRHTFAIRTDEMVACWGYNKYGRSTPPTW
jgi:alpha-tubulin suppressor-like RCC1 family protein